MSAPWNVIKVAETGSTNADLLALAATGIGRTVLVADHQTAGRGRLDRTWEAPAGANLLASLLFTAVPVPGPHRLTQQVAVAAARASERLGHVRPELKWPNDLLIDDRKLAGILAQAGVVGGRVDHVVVGIGVNLGWAPVGAALLAGVGRDEFLHAMLEELATVENAADGGAEEYRSRLATLGQNVRVELPSGSFTGQALDVRPDGRLVVQTAEGERVFDTGDVIHLRHGTAP